MHEMSITEDILDIIRREMKKGSLTHLISVKLRLGELTAIDPDALRFCFDASIKKTGLEGAVLEIEGVPLTGRCTMCATTWKITDFALICPACSGTDVEKIAGTELDIVSIDAL